MMQYRRGVAPMMVLLALPALPALAADHREAPIIQEDPTADIADVYAFVNPKNSNMLVLAMTVNPFSAPAEAITYNFSPNVRYRFNVDNNGDAKEDAVIDVTFTPVSGGRQLLAAFFPGNIVMTGQVTPPTEEPDPNPPIINRGPRGIQLFAGPRDDPFFFDIVGFFRFLSGTGGFSGDDGFAGFNVSSIVIELPLDIVSGGNRNLQVWGETARRKATIRPGERGALERHTGEYKQVERMGNPAVATALIPSTLKDLYNVGRPKDDAEDFADAIVASLRALGTNEENIAILASVAVPDTLKVNLDDPIGFPNGRKPDDDVIDTLLFFIFNQQEVPDGVDANDRSFLNTFPYLADPWQPR